MADPRVRTEELFDADFLASLAGLRIVARRVPRGGRFAEQRSQDLGSGLEFRDFRPYAPGDDPRSIDWNIYRRLKKVVLRLYEEWEDLPVYLLPDASQSMVLEEPPRLRAALRAGLALAAIAMGQHDPVGVFALRESLQTVARPRTGRRRVLAVAEDLARVEAGGQARTRACLEHFARLPLRKGLAVVISDFLDPAGIEEVLAGLRSLRHRLVLVQITQAHDADPRLQGDVRLVDCETGHATDVSITPAVLERYRAVRARHQQALTDFCTSRGVPLIPVDAAQPVVPQLAALFERRSLSV